MPVLATAMFWTYLDRTTQVLVILLLLILIAKNLGVPTTKLYSRIENSWFGKSLKFFLRIVSPIAKMNEEYFEETSEIVAEQIKPVIKKIKEEMKMSKFKKWQAEALTFLTSNKKMFTVYIVVILFFLDSLFGWSKKYNLPPDVWYYVATFVMFLVLWAVGGEGWTGNTLNKLRNETAINKAATKAESKKWQQKLDAINLDIDEILADRIDGIIPPHLKQRYDELMKSKGLYKQKVDELLAKLNPNEELE